MAKSSLLLLLQLFALLSASLWLCSAIANGERTADGSEEWGYVEVRPKAHMFWWLYRSPHRVAYSNASQPWPIVLWLQGGPGGSGVGIGNFQEIGPLDVNLKARKSTWLQHTDLLFVDNPVGTGFSYVEDDDQSLMVKTDEEAASDLTTLLKYIFNKNVAMQMSPFYIFAESYGGKYAVTLALSAAEAIHAGNLKLKLTGVALGNSWISPEDSVSSWGPLLKDMSRLDSSDMEAVDSVVEKIKREIEDGQFVNATDSWNRLEEIIEASSNHVNFYNILLDNDVGEGSILAAAPESTRINGMRLYSNYLSSIRSILGGDDLDSLMNGDIRKKLKIIPDNVVWGKQANSVFHALKGDFMKPRINEVDLLLDKGINVTIYSGQLDVICSTKGTQAWVEKLRWKGLQKLLSKKRAPLLCKDDGPTKGFTKSYDNLSFYWILGAGHFVPVDQPCVALNMVHGITQSLVHGF